MAQVVLTDNARAVSTLKNPSATALTVTSNAVVGASGFAITPTVADNGSDEVPVTFTATGARKGISNVLLEFSDFGCYRNGFVSISGTTVSVPFTIGTSTRSCGVTGIAVIDGAGDLSLYGTEYRTGHDLGLTVTQVPNTTAPVVTGASLSVTTVAESELGSVNTMLTAQTTGNVAPVNLFYAYAYAYAYAYVYDADGNVVTGGTSQAPDGSVSILISLPWWEPMPPGTYTVGFSLADSAGNASYWGMPDSSESHPIPGGPVTLTITEG
jgi:hypothetical protein